MRFADRASARFKLRLNATLGALLAQVNARVGELPRK